MTNITFTIEIPSFIKSHNKVLFEFRHIFYLGSKLYYMNQNGGLSYFDIKTGNTTESLDNTTFVSDDKKKHEKTGI